MGQTPPTRRFSAPLIATEGHGRKGNGPSITEHSRAGGSGRRGYVAPLGCVLPGIGAVSRPWAMVSHNKRERLHAWGGTRVVQGFCRSHERRDSY